MRLFVALELPARARQELFAWSRLLDEAVWRRVPEANLHVTLAFLGERPEATVPDIAEAVRAAVAAAGARAPDLRCSGVLGLPSRRPRVVALGLEESGSSAMAPLHAAVAGDLAAAGHYALDPRPFLAHVTVGRVRRGARGSVPASLAPPGCAFAASAVTLLRSRPGRGASVYEPVASVALG